MIEPRGEFSEQLEIPDKCRDCVTLARIAFRYSRLSDNLAEATEAGLSGEIVQRWVEEVAKEGGMSQEDAAEFVAHRKPEFMAEFLGRLEGIDGKRDVQLHIAREVVAHCLGGMLTLQSEQNGEHITVEMCGSAKPESLIGVENAQVVRVIRQTATAKVTD